MKRICSLLQFTTILPIGKSQDLGEFGRNSYLYPLAGYVIGGLVALPVFFIADKTIAAAVSIALILLITGAHHFDGLIDFGDGLMAHGDREKRVRALTDRYVGAGGIGAGIVVTLLLFAGLSGSSSIAYVPDSRRGLRKIFHGVPDRIWYTVQGRNTQLSSPVLSPLLPVYFFPPLYPPCSLAHFSMETCCCCCRYDHLPHDSAYCITEIVWRGKRGCRRCFKRDNPGMCYPRNGNGLKKLRDTTIINQIPPSNV